MTCPSRGPRPGPPGDLREELERALGGAIVGEVQGDVGRHHGSQHDIGQVEALRRQLGADQHVRPAFAEVVVHRLEGTPLREGVAVQAPDAQPREARTQLGLDPLCAGPEVPNAPRPAARAAIRHGRAAAAVVAAQLPAGEVEDVRQVAVRAAKALAAVAAQDEGGGAPAVDEQDSLSPTLAQAGNPLGQKVGKDRPVSRRELGAHVDDLHGRGPTDAPL